MASRLRKQADVLRDDRGIHGVSVCLLDLRDGVLQEHLANLFCEIISPWAEARGSLRPPALWHAGICQRRPGAIWPGECDRATFILSHTRDWSTKEGYQGFSIALALASPPGDARGVASVVATHDANG